MTEYVLFSATGKDMLAWSKQFPGSTVERNGDE